MQFKIHTKYKKVLADLYTPVAIYNKLRDKFSNALLLESADYQDRTDSKSFICLEPIAGFEAKANSYYVSTPPTPLPTQPIFCLYAAVAAYKPDLILYRLDFREYI
jgi:anthranilate/para-aminobenzoate synthase component I